MHARSIARMRLGCKPELIVDEFGEKLLEELDYTQEARNIQVGARVGQGQQEEEEEER